MNSQNGLVKTSGWVSLEAQTIVFHAQIVHRAPVVQCIRTRSSTRKCWRQLRQAGMPNRQSLPSIWKHFDSNDCADVGHPNSCDLLLCCTVIDAAGLGAVDMDADRSERFDRRDRRNSGVCFVILTHKIQHRNSGHVPQHQGTEKAIWTVVRLMSWNVLDNPEGKQTSLR